MDFLQFGFHRQEEPTRLRTELGAPREVAAAAPPTLRRRAPPTMEPAAVESAPVSEPPPMTSASLYAECLSMPLLSVSTPAAERTAALPPLPLGSPPPRTPVLLPTPMSSPPPAWTSTVSATSIFARSTAAPHVKEPQLWSTVEQILAQIERRRVAGVASTAEETATYEALQRTVDVHRALARKESEIVQAKAMLLSELNTDLRALRRVEVYLASAERDGRRSGVEGRCLSAVRSALIFSGFSNPSNRDGERT